MPTITGYGPESALANLYPRQQQAEAAVNVQSQARVETQVAQQVASAAPDADVNVQYRYASGPDGELVVSSATVTITQEVPDPSQSSAQSTGNRVNSIEDIVDVGNGTATPDDFGLSAGERELLRRLQAADVAVRRHEGLHFRAAAGLGNAPDYTTVKGPDGQYYAVGGSVSVATTSGADPEKAAREAETLGLAATAPGDASAQDLSAARQFTQGSAAGGNDARTGEREQPPGNLIDLIV